MAQDDCGYFAEGELRHGLIRAARHRHPDVRFTYRPMTAPERADALKRVGGCRDPIRRESIRAEVLRERLHDWNLRDSGGALVPIEVENLLRVEPHLLGRLFEVATGTGVTDEIPVQDNQRHASREGTALRMHS